MSVYNIIRCVCAIYSKIIVLNEKFALQVHSACIVLWIYLLFLNVILGKRQHNPLVAETESQDTETSERPNSARLARLFWKQDIDLQILYSSKNVIDTIISYKGKTFLATFVYGAPEAPHRSAIWDILISFSLTRNSLLGFLLETSTRSSIIVKNLAARKELKAPLVRFAAC